MHAPRPSCSKLSTGHGSLQASTWTCGSLPRTATRHSAATRSHPGRRTNTSLSRLNGSTTAKSPYLTETLRPGDELGTRSWHCLSRCSRSRIGAPQRATEALPGVDSEFRVDLPQVPLDGAVADVQLRTNLRVGMTLAGKSRDLRFLRREVIAGVVSALAHLLASG